MRDELMEWQKRINRTPLPILKNTALYFAQQKSNPGSTISGLWACLQYDIGMCLNLLRATGHSKRTRVNDVNHAILMLGLPNTFNRAAHLPKIEDIKDTSTQKLLLSINNDCFHTYSIYQSSTYMEKETSRERQTATLLVGFIDYLLCLADKERYQALRQQEQRGTDRIQAETDILGVSRQELALKIATNWQLPELIIKSHQVSPAFNNPLQDVLLCLKLQQALKRGWYHADMEDVIKEIAAFTLIPEDTLTKDLHRHSVQTARTSTTLFPEAPKAAARLIEHETMPRQKPKPETIVTQIIRIKQYKQSAEALQKHEQLTYQTIFTHCFEGFEKGLGLSRMLFGFLSTDKTHLKVVYSRDAKNDKSLHQLQIELTNKNLFYRLLLKPTGLWVNNTNIDKYQSYLPKVYLDEINSQHFFAMSMHVHNQPLGVLFADLNGAENLTDEQFKYFKHLCKITNAAFEALSDKQKRKKIA